MTAIQPMDAPLFATIGEPGEVAPSPALVRTLDGGPNMAKGTCCIDGCHREAKAPRGWCWGHYNRWRRHGDVLAGGPPILGRGMAVPDRFWWKVDKSGPGGCWLWKGTIDDAGYGLFLMEGRLRKAHRTAWFLTYGEWPTETLDHVRARGCFHRNCVNPEHLEDVSASVNVRRGGNGGKTHCVRGHPFAGANLRVNERGHRTCRACHQIRKRQWTLRKRAAS